MRTGLPPSPEIAMTEVGDPSRSPSDAENVIASRGQRIDAVEAMGDETLGDVVETRVEAVVHDRARAPAAATNPITERIYGGDIAVAVSVPDSRVRRYRRLRISPVPPLEPQRLRCYRPTVRRSIESGTDCLRKDGGLVASVTVVSLARPDGGLFVTR